MIVVVICDTFISSKVNPLSNLVCTNGLIPDNITIKDLVILQVVDLDIT